MAPQGKIDYERDAGCMKRRVVITGMGVVSPNGIGNEAFCRAALAGVTGVQRITRFDTSELPVQIAGEVAGFDDGGHQCIHRRQAGRPPVVGLSSGMPMNQRKS